MARRLFTFICLLSLLLGAATAVLWVRSYRYYDGIGRMNVNAVHGNRSDLTFHGIACAEGHVTLARIETQQFRSVDPPLSGWYRNHERRQWLTWITPNAWGFGLSWATIKYTSGMVQTTTAWSVPLWLVATLCAILPATALARRRRRSGRVAGGYCVRCGYDLRATPARCPECGTLVPQKVGVAQ